jgi:hypothetical protein
LPDALPRHASIAQNGIEAYRLPLCRHTVFPYASTLFFVLTKQRQLLRMGYHLRGYLNHLSKEKRHGNDSMETGSQRPHHPAVVQNPFRAAHVLLLADAGYQTA